MLKRHRLLVFLLLCVVGAGAYFAWLNRPVPDFGRKVLVFSKTGSARHASIPKGIEAIETLGHKARFNVQASEDASLFTDKSLSGFGAVIFLNTSGDVLDADQQTAFERYIQAGGGYVGIHSAADTESQSGAEWPWYQRLVGGVFAVSAELDEQTAALTVRDTAHPATAGLPPWWEISDTWPDFRRLSMGIDVLVTVDETNYEGAKMGAGVQHPVAWAREFDGGRSFYTAVGHADSSYEDAGVLALLQGGIEYALGEGTPLDYSQSRPEAWRFTRTVLDSNLNEPLKIAFSPYGELYFVERRGNLRRYDFEQGKSITVHQFADVRSFSEYGLLGLAFDPDFENNHWLYLYRTLAEGDAGRHVLSRFKLTDGALDESSEQVLLSMSADGTTSQRTAHTGGDMLFDDKGRLWISTGDDTNAADASNIDDRPGHIGNDAARSAGNTQDLRGKILRLKPRAAADENGRYYDIPEGNLFASAADGRPEIYVMGLRNPYTLAYDYNRQRIYWGEVGPDGQADSDRGPRGFDEVNFAEKPGNFGWPFVIANNQPYHYYDYAAGEALGLADINAPENRSRNNTGLKILPPAQPAWMYYPYDESEAFFELGTGGRNALVAPIYDSKEVAADSEIKFPPYFDGKLLISDFVRRWLMVVNTDEHGQPESIVPLFDQQFSAPLDMAYGPDGALYVVEYGTNWFTQNEDAYISRIEYYSGDNPPPVAVASASRTIGAAPLTASLDASESFDRGAGDGTLSYRWQLIENDSPGEVIGEQQVQPYIFEQPGMYAVQLTVTDEGGQEDSQRIRFQVGNERPQVTVKADGNRSFYWESQPLAYEVNVEDKEDGSTTSGELTATDVVVKFGYVAGGEDLAKVLAQESVNPVLAGRELVERGSDCHACHGIDSASVGPSFSEVAKRYEERSDAAAYLQAVIADGGRGRWGSDHAMPPHPALSTDQLGYISSFILSLSGTDMSEKGMPLSGAVQFDQHQDDFIDVTAGDTIPVELGRFYTGTYLLVASYTDKGNDSAPALQGQETLVLRSPRLSASAFSNLVNVLGYAIGGQKIGVVSAPQASDPFSYGLLNNIDLTGINRIKVSAIALKPIMSGGLLELRLDSPDAKPVASAEVTAKLIPDFKGAPIELDVSTVEGIHDLYIGAPWSDDNGSVLYAILIMEFLR